MTRDEAREIYFLFGSRLREATTVQEEIDLLIDCDVALGYLKLVDEPTFAPVHTIVGAERARDYLVKLMGARLADQLLAQLYAAGFKITPIKRDE